MDIEKIRQRYLINILEEKFDGNRPDLAKKLSIAPTTLNKYLSKGKYRPISDHTARRFEKKLGLSQNTFDHAYHLPNINTYYVRVTFSGGHPREFLCNLYRHEIVKEASAQYGEYDIFIKIVATEEEYHNLTFNNIRQFPGVIKTTTSKALSTARWQRSQPEHYEITKETITSNIVLQSYIEAKRHELYEELQALDKGNEIVVHRDEINPLDFYELLENAKSSIKMTLFYNHRTQKRLEEEIFNLIATTKPDVKYKILLLINNRMSPELLEKLTNFKDQLNKDNRTKVLTIEERDWKGNKLERGGLTLTIIDDLVTSILNRDSFTLGYKKEGIDRYNKLFKRNWGIAKYPPRFY